MFDSLAEGSVFEDTRRASLPRILGAVLGTMPTPVELLLFRQHGAEEVGMSLTWDEFWDILMNVFGALADPQPSDGGPSSDASSSADEVWDGEST